ncbi:MAG: hypothetical protein DMF67_17385 [Acidobacteria bacterium]|nr:MAG: hypothetical protein DMF67_17385 [Acidobacteriota bacterium]
MRPFIPYARVSSDEQKDAETIKTQIAEVEAHARSSETALAAWVTDDGVSGMIPFHERRGGARVLELLRTGDYAGIVCLNHKRVGRDAYVIHLAVRQIEQELRLDIQAVREPVPGQLAPGARALMRAMYAGVAQYDREEDLASMRAGKERAAREGRYVGGTVPFGLKLEALRAPGRRKPVKRLVPDEETAPTVLRIFSLYAAGRSQWQVSWDLQAEGAPHPTNGVWKQSTVSYVLRNPAYKGEGVWRRRSEAKTAKGTRTKRNSPPERVIAYEDYRIPAVVPAGLWDACARLRAENVRLASRNAKHLYLLRGLARCGLCGRTLAGVCQNNSEGRRYFYYRCTSRSDASVSPCGLRNVRAEALERVVWSGVERIALSPGKVLSKIRAAMEARSGKAEGRDASRLLAVKARERERLITLARKGIITEDELAAQLSQLRAESAALEAEAARRGAALVAAAEVRSLICDAESFLDVLARRVHECTREEMAAILRRAVPRVVVRPRPDGRRVAEVAYRLIQTASIATNPL